MIIVSTEKENEPSLMIEIENEIWTKLRLHKI